MPLLPSSSAAAAFLVSLPAANALPTPVGRALPLPMPPPPVPPPIPPQTLANLTLHINQTHPMPCRNSPTPMLAHTSHTQGSPAAATVQSRGHQVGQPAAPLVRRGTRRGATLSPEVTALRRQAHEAHVQRAGACWRGRNGSSCRHRRCAAHAATQRPAVLPTFHPLSPAWHRPLSPSDMRSARPLLALAALALFVGAASAVRGPPVASLCWRRCCCAENRAGLCGEVGARRRRSEPSAPHMAGPMHA